MAITPTVNAYPCGKKVSYKAYSGKVPESANGSSQNNAGSSLIPCEALKLVLLFQLQSCKWSLKKQYLWFDVTRLS